MKSSISNLDRAFGPSTVNAGFFFPEPQIDFGFQFLDIIDLSGISIITSFSYLLIKF